MAREPFALGGLLRDNTPVQMPAAGPRPQNPLAAVAGTAGQKESQFQSLLQNPAVMAFLAQSAASMLAQRGIGPSLGDAAGAAGRSARMMQETKREDEQEQYRRGQDQQANARADRTLELREQAAARAGRGGTGRSSSGYKSFDDPKTVFDDLLEAEKLAYKTRVDNLPPGTDPPPPPDPIAIRAEAEEIARLSAEEREAYIEVRRAAGPDAARMFLQELRTGGLLPQPETPASPAEVAPPPPMQAPQYRTPGQPLSITVPPKPQGNNPSVVPGMSRPGQ